MNTDIVFISFPKPWPPYSLLSLASYINEKTSHRANILDLKGVPNIQETILDYVHRNKPGLIGFTCFTCDYPEVMRLSRLLKANSNCTIVVGNVHASLFPEDFIFKGSPVDFAVIGEGEITLMELMNTVAKKKNCVGIPGIATLDSEKKMVVGKKRPVLEDLSVLPRIDYTLVPIKTYFRPSSRLIRGINSNSAIVFASRGCPSVCEFCAANTVWKCNTGSIVRFRPIEAVMEEIFLLKDEYQIQAIFFGDDTFLIQKERVLRFCSEMKKTGLFWAIQGKVNQINEELAGALKEAGCLMIYFGVESGSDVVLKRIKKGIRVEQIKKAFAICKKYGLMRMADIMCNHPEETEKDVELTINLLKQIKPEELSQSVMTPYPGTPIYEKYVDKKTKNYEIFRNIGPDIVKYFKLCEHDLPVQKILDDYWRSVHAYRLPGSVTLPFKNPHYLRRVVFSKYSADVLKTIFGDFSRWAHHEIVSSIPWSIRRFLRHLKSLLSQRLVE